MDKMFKFLGVCFVTFICLLAGGLLLGRNENILMIFSFAAPLVLFLYPRIICTLQVYKMERDDEKSKGKILCYIPIFNTYFSRKMQYYVAPVIGGLLIFVCAELFVINPIVRFLLVNSEWRVVLNVIVSYFNILAVLILWGVEAFVNVQLARQVGYSNILLCIILPPVGAYFLSGKMSAYFNKNKNEIKGVFAGGK